MKLQKPKIGRLSVFVTAALFACILPSLLEANNRPLVQIVPLEPFTLPAGDSGCSFAIAIAPLSNKEKLTTFFDQQGAVRMMIVSGVRKVQLTNQSTGKMIALNISGPAQIQENSDGTFTINGEGSSTFIFAPGVAPDLPLHAYIVGRIVAITDENLNIIRVVSLDARVQDVCALLS